MKHIAFLVAIIIAVAVVSITWHKHKESYAQQVTPHACGTVRLSCSEYLTQNTSPSVADPIYRAKNSIRDKYAREFNAWPIEQKQTMAYMDAREATADNEGKCFFDGCVMTKQTQNNYKLSDGFCESKGLKRLANGDCYIGMNTPGDIDTTRAFLGAAYDIKFAQEMQEKRALDAQAASLSNVIAGQNVVMTNQTQTINNLNGQVTANRNQYYATENTNNQIRGSITQLSSQAGSLQSVNANVVAGKDLTVSRDMYRTAAISGSPGAPLVLVKRFTTPQTGAVEEYGLVYKYAFTNTNQVVDPYALWIGDYGRDVNLGAIKDQNFISNTTNYRYDDAISALVSRSSYRSFNIVVEVYKDNVPLITLFFRHNTSDSSWMSEYANQISSWFRYQNLINSQEERELSSSYWYSDFSIAGTGQAGGRSRWVIMNNQGRYIMAVPISSQAGTWESKARGQPIVLKDFALNPVDLARMTDQQILSTYGGNKLAVYLRQMN